MKMKQIVMLTMLIAFGGIFSGCTAQLEKAKEMYASASKMYVETKKVGAALNEKTMKLDELLAEAEAKEANILAMVDKNMDGKLSEQELKSPSIIGLIFSTYQKEGMKGVTILLITLFILFQGNHVFEWRAKLKQYGGGFLKRMFGKEKKPLL